MATTHAAEHIERCFDHASEKIKNGIRYAVMHETIARFPREDTLIAGIVLVAIRDKIFEMFMQAMSEAAFIGRRYGFMQLEAKLRSYPPSFLTTLIVNPSKSKPGN